MKKIIIFSCFLYFFGFCSFIPQAYAFSGTGAGTTNDPYMITSCELLQEMDDDTSSSYALGNDVDCAVTNPSDSNWSNSGTWSDGKGFNPIGGTFSGNLYGYGYLIKNLFISRPTEPYVGLFSSVHGGGIGNIGLVNVNISGASYAGALVGSIRASSTVSKVFSTGTVSAASYGGGLIGFGSTLTINNSYSTVNVTSSSFGGSLMGLLEGGSTTTNSYSAGTVTSSAGKGMIGVNQDIYFDYILEEYVTQENVFNNNFYDSTKGSVGDSGKGTPKTTIEMQTQDTFTDWDFSTIWGINPALNLGYPYLLEVLDAAPLTPVASPNAGSFSSNQNITLSSVGSDSIRYSTTAIPADCSSGTLYSGPISVTISQTIYVRACDTEQNYSTNSFAYEISIPEISIPRKSGTSLKRRIENLKSMGQNDKAETLIEQYTSEFSAKDTEILNVAVDLKYKIENSDVNILQNFLISQNIGPASFALKSHGTTNYFGQLTKNALIEWQTAKGITPSMGYFGPKTRAYISGQQ